MNIKSIVLISALGLSIAACGDKLEVKKTTSAPAESSKTVEASTTPAPTASVEITATQLLNDYKANETAFNDKIKGKLLVTSGEVSAVDKTPDDQVVVHLKTADEITEAHFYMTAAAKADASSIKADSKVKISCQKMTLDTGAPKGTECTLVK